MIASDAVLYDYWREYVAGFVRALTGAEETGASCPAPVPPLTAARPVVLLSPHPDDETITGLLPLRLAREAGQKVVNLALTFGSDPARKAARRDELAAADLVTGFASQPVAGDLGFDRLLLPGLSDDCQWRQRVEILVARFRELRPTLVLHPHADDRHPAHVATARLAAEALDQYSREEGETLLIAETECWQPMAEPNLLVGAAADAVALLCLALSKHAGEVARNPYHRRQPVRMMDTVWRGGEILGGFGGKAPDLVFGEAYRLRRWRHGLVEEAAASRVLPPDEAVSFSVLEGMFVG